MVLLSSPPRTSLLQTVLSFGIGLLVGACILSTSPANTVPSDEEPIRTLRSDVTYLPDEDSLAYTVLDNTLPGEEGPGCPETIRLTFVILSSPYQAPRRAAIRRSWLQLYRDTPNVQVLPRFVIGLQDLTESVVNEMITESNRYQDMLLFNDFKDSYYNLTIKVLMSVLWAHQKTNFDYVIKCDDDSWVQIDRFVAALRKMNCPERLYWGYFVGRSIPDPNGKWAESNWYMCKNFLPYGMGGGYVLSRKIIDILSKYSHHLTVYNNEDVSFGAWMAPYRVRRVHDVRFNVEGNSHGCDSNYIVSHKERVSTFLDKRSSMLANGTLCPKKREIRPSFIYNWNNSPPDCCNRSKGIFVPR